VLERGAAGIAASGRDGEIHRVVARRYLARQREHLQGGRRYREDRSAEPALNPAVAGGFNHDRKSPVSGDLCLWNRPFGNCPANRARGRRPDHNGPDHQRFDDGLQHRVRVHGIRFRGHSGLFASRQFGQQHRVLLPVSGWADAGPLGAPHRVVRWRQHGHVSRADLCLQLLFRWRPHAIRRAPLTLPAPPSGNTAEFTERFSLRTSGPPSFSFVHFDPGGDPTQALDVAVRGSGTVTVSMDISRVDPQEGPLYIGRSARYDFAATPEPGSLFLIGTGIAVGWWRRLRAQL
jgi:PEP-CTERM motif